MSNRCLIKALPAVSLMIGGIFSSQTLLAQQYGQRFGDFPPRTIDEQLQRSQDLTRQPEKKEEKQQAREQMPEPRNTNPWSTGQYPPPPPQGYSGGGYPSRPYYGGYPGGRSGPNFSGPWDRRGSSWSPWSNRRGGGWGGNRNPFRHKDMSDWFDPNKGTMSRNWDDMLNAPSRMGDMPGGWTAPSVDVPNPVDVGDELERASRDLPDQMDNFQWNENRRRYR